MKTRARGVELSLLCLVILGALPIIASRRPTDCSALLFAFLLTCWQLAPATPVYAAERRAATGRPSGRGHPVRFSRLHSTTLTVITGGLFGLATYFYILSVEKAGPVSFAIAAQAYPLFAILWESLFLHRRRNAAELAFMGAIAAAMVYLGTQGTWRFDAGSRWSVLALLVPFLWSVAHVIVKELLDASAVTPSQIIFTRLLISAAFLGAALLMTEGPTAVFRAAADLRFQLIAALMGIAYYLELLGWFYAVKHIDVSVAASITAPSPVITMLLAVMVLGQPVQGYQITALVIVVGCMFGLIRAGARTQRVPQNRDA